MEGECYRFCSFKSKQALSVKEKSAYTGILFRIISEVQLWLRIQNPAKWTVNFDGVNALELQAKDCEHFSRQIILPRELNNSLAVGWQHRRYGSVLDPNFEIADKIINLFVESEIFYLIKFEAKDNIAEDRDLGYYNQQNCQSKGLFHYSAGISDDAWSPDGLYGGYDDWETYLDANGIEGESRD